MRGGSNDAVVSDTVDRLEMRTVPESALPRNDPTSYAGTHARRRFVPLSIDHRCLHLELRQRCVDKEEVKELTLTRREEMVTAILRLEASRFYEGCTVEAAQWSTNADVGEQVARLPTEPNHVIVRPFCRE
ncbi:hypothetical protein SCHPADRAFT_494270 [Schizopora paradoxa]|uniref:Uncharacterized protein n=1 Tax=Schizopora paradoxa TaxID=27342 RepID=A0A0H2RGK8_9AGAM|nr:hypothetical protein SCHPADRAFT_494270 [Schizopora paradoxa]